MTRAGRLVHVHTSWLFVAAAVGQALAVGLGAPSGTAATVLESSVGLMALASVLTAIASERDRRETAFGLALVVLYFVGASLPDGVPSMAGGPANLALVVPALMVAVGLWQAHRATVRLMPRVG